MVVVVVVAVAVAVVVVVVVVDVEVVVVVVVLWWCCGRGRGRGRGCGRCGCGCGGCCGCCGCGGLWWLWLCCGRCHHTHVAVHMRVASHTDILETTWCAIPLLERRLDTEVSCAMNDVRAMYQTTTSLQMARPGHQPVDETAINALSPHWDMDTVQ